MIQKTKINFSSCAYFNSIIKFVKDKSDRFNILGLLVGVIEMPCDANNNLFIFDLIRLNYGGCSLMAERVVVVRKTGVRFTPSTLFKRRMR